ncbi:mobilization protein [Bifidobacterium reuteri DSM 23975]|uniref:Mobilization protein n=1 Tax=Bifidobacterium reuteri DSM 23975 TaxID=1437610 RepID=A0A087CIU2_9BIFI|nr:plasmid mobilization relaxosome protein MobC [Bifidobacterium reuteri]KFI83192.1 mobilization protein [Bifidobacterium reuteri DSM 23975]
MGESVNRRRPVVRKVTFTHDEWRQADAFYQRVRRARGGALPFTSHARDLLINAHAVTVTVALDPAMVRADMARIGGNINQIAHRANIAGHASSAELALVLEAQDELRALLARMCRERDEALEAAGWRSSR